MTLSAAARMLRSEPKNGGQKIAVLGEMCHELNRNIGKKYPHIRDIEFDEL